MKPDWKDSPEWANWLAMDEDGAWYWFQFEPTCKFSYWEPNYSGSVASATSPTTPWRDSLEQRP